MPRAFEKEHLFLLELFNDEIHAKVVDLIVFELPENDGDQIKDVKEIALLGNEIDGVDIHARASDVDLQLILVVGKEFAIVMESGDGPDHGEFVLEKSLSVDSEPFDGVFFVLGIDQRLQDGFIKRGVGFVYYTKDLESVPAETSYP